jgi:catechol 2,3-dioxygenase-like lactoylglutathione lyase family enzyme
MKRFHVHVAVENLEDSVRFYSELFAAEPVVRKPDYAKWASQAKGCEPAVTTAAPLKRCCE